MDVETLRTFGKMAQAAAADENLPAPMRDAAEQMAGLVREAFAGAGLAELVPAVVKPVPPVSPPSIQLAEPPPIKRPITIGGNAVDGYAVTTREGATEADERAAKIAQEIFDWASGKPMGPLSGLLLHCATVALRLEQELGVKLA